MNQSEYITERNKWLEEVSEQCHQFALETDLDFYAFQTPIDKYNPELLIIGINPGGGRSYSSILKEKGQEKRQPSDLAYDINTLTTKPQWEIDWNLKGNDVMRDRFKRVFNEKNGLGDVLSDSVMMNMYYFNTPTVSDLTLISNQARAYCLSKTKEFIEILNPKNILFLTSEASNLKLCDVRDIQRLGSNVSSGNIKGRKIYAIPHYGYHGAYSEAKANEMGLMLSKVLDLNKSS